ncbi:MAG: hypothetical protein AB7E95_02155 [Kiritimatiellales bacterium]
MKKFRFWLLIPALLPLSLKANYLWLAWRTSPLDRPDWILLLTAAIFAAARRRTLRAWSNGADLRGLIPAAASLLLYIAFTLKPISTLQVAAGLVLFFSMLWVLGGLRLFSGCLPLLAICLLACPSTTYWIEFYLRVLLRSDLLDGRVAKLFTASALALWFALSSRPIRLQTAAYLCGTAALCALLVLRTSRPLYGNPLIPDFNAIQVGSCLASSISPTAQEKSFFAGNRLIKTAYYGEHGEAFHLLSVEITDDIHKLHPTELCLRSKKTVIRDLHEKTFTAGSGRRLALQELVAVRNGNRYLIYTWYTGPNWSTGSFIAFRKNWAKDESWRSFQLLTEITETRDAAEKRLNTFLKQLLVTPDTD